MTTPQDACKVCRHYRPYDWTTHCDVFGNAPTVLCTENTDGYERRRAVRLRYFEDVRRLAEKKMGK